MQKYKKNLTLLLYMFNKFYFHDTQLTLCLSTVPGFEQIQLASDRLSQLRYSSKSILILTGTFQTDGNFVGLHTLGRCQMDISQTTFCLTAPDKLFASIHLYRITAQTPTGQLQANIINNRFLRQFIGYPSRRESSVVFPFRQFIIIIAANTKSVFLLFNETYAGFTPSA